MVYASFVKNLEIYDKNTKKYSVLNWRGFAAHARNKTLLPNLKALTVDTTSDYSNQFMWIRAFLSPSLLDINVTPSPECTPMISYLEASTMLRHIAAICPNLTKLSLFPDSEISNPTTVGSEDKRTMLDFWDSALPQYLRQMTSLRQLSSTTEILMPYVLEHTAELTNLEHLNIYPATGALQIYGDVSKYTFPSLRRFELCSCDYTLVDVIWRFGFFKNLTALAIDFISCPSSEDPQREAWGIRFMTMICDASPNIVELGLDFNAAESLEEDDLFLMGYPSLLYPMQKLPLNDLLLRGASLGEYSDKIFSIIPTAWAHVTELRLPDERGTQQTLPWFAELPNLKRLTLWLGLQVPGAETIRVSHPKNRCFEMLESTGKVDVTGDMLPIARCANSLRLYCLMLTALHHQLVVVTMAYAKESELEQ